MKKRVAVWVIWGGLIGSGLCLATCVVLFIARGLGSVVYDAMKFDRAIKVGSLAPDFTLATLSGEQVQLSQYRGQPVVLSFGATWCPDCKRGLSLLKRLHEQYAELQVLAVDSNEDTELVRGYMNDNGVSFTVALDPDGAVFRQYRIYAVPTVLLINKAGAIQRRYLETVPEAEVEQALNAIGITP
jgi:peroxiredoxin